MADATKAAEETASYFLRWEIVETVLAGHAEGLTKDQLAERVRFVIEERAATREADVAHYRQRLLAVARRVPAQ